jgi:hypothetical protein
MRLSHSELLPGEQVVLSKRANAAVRPTDYGLERFPFGRYLGLVGMKDLEAIGGKLHLTTARLMFKAHSLNRVGGSMSIFLPSIREAADASRFVNRKVRIETASQQFEFVIWGVRKFLSALQSQRAAQGHDERAELLSAIREHPDLLVEGLTVSPGVDQFITQAARVLDTRPDPGDDSGLVSSLINLADLLYED